MSAGKLIAPFSTTGIGSLPHTNPDEAAGLVLETLDIPFWPQLPGVSFREFMIPQYSEGMPGIRIDPENQSFHIERDEEAIARFYETPSDKIAISEDYAAGLYAFIKKLSGRRAFLKGHVTGPLTFTLGLKDLGGRPLYFDEELREIALLLISAKARWQIDLLGSNADNVIIFIDEPILTALGSTSYMGVRREEALRLLKETVRAVKAADGIAGIHSCGRTEWPLLFESGIDILNFDAFGFGDTLAIYPDEVTAFLVSGGCLAWGVVPTLDPETLAASTVDSVGRVFRERFDALSEKIPEELLAQNILLTPSCGAGSRTEAEARKIFEILKSLKGAIR